MDPYQNQINEEDLEYIFSGKKKKKKSKTLTTFKYTLLFLAIALAIFFSINYQALLKEMGFWYHQEYKNDTTTVDQTSSNLTSRSASSITSSIPTFSDNHILVPSISIDAPITWMVENAEAATSKALENGSIHLLGTATPGTVGNVFITGHSSNYVWAAGHYKSVFALLDKLAIGDLIYLKYQNQSYTYKVYSKKVIKPSDTSVLNQSQKSILTLMTCTPVGTSLNRLIVQSNQIFPDPKTNMSSNISQSSNNLPNVR